LGISVSSHSKNASRCFVCRLTSHTLTSCDFVSQEIGFVVGGSGTILKTTDGGQNWEFMNSTTSQSLTSVQMQNESIGVVVGHGIILKTTDGGSSWIQKQVITDLAQDKSNDITSFILVQNYPNPFNPNTTIKYQIPEISFVTLKIYDVLGKEIATLVSDEKPTGSYEVEFNGTGLPSGLYFYQLRVYPAEGGAGDPSTGLGQSFVETKKMVLLK